MKPHVHPTHGRLALTGIFAGGFALPAAAQDPSAVSAGRYKTDPAHPCITFSYNPLGLSDPKLAFDDFEDAAAEPLLQTYGSPTGGGRQAG